MRNIIAQTTMLSRWAWRAAAITALTIVPIAPGPAHGGTVEQLAGRTLSLEERTKLTCPEPDAPGAFAVPVEILPSPKMAVWVTYSQGDDLIRLVGDETEVIMDFAGGDDIALLYDIGAGADIIGGVGADTILLCSMDDLGVSISLGTENLTRDSDRDVVIIESPIFSTVPAGMLREIAIFGFDADTDRLIIHAPAQMLQTRESSRQIGGIRIGDVLLKLYNPIGAEQLNYDDEAIILIPDDP